MNSVIRAYNSSTVHHEDTSESMVKTNTLQSGQKRWPLTLSDDDHNDNEPAGCHVYIEYEKPPLDFGYYVSGPALTVFLIIGLLGNGLCLSIFCRQRRLPTIYLYLIPLCVCDLALLAAAFVLYNLPHLLFGRMLTYGMYVKTYPYAYAMTHVAHSGCVWLVVLLAGERYFALCHPLKHKIYDTKRRTMLVVALALFVAILYNASKYFEISLIDCYDRNTKRWTILVSGSEFRKHVVYWAVYRLLGGVALFSVGPFGAICYFSVRVWNEMRRRSNSNCHQRQQQYPNQHQSLSSENSGRYRLRQRPKRFRWNILLHNRDRLMHKRASILVDVHNHHYLQQQQQQPSSPALSISPQSSNDFNASSNASCGAQDGLRRHNGRGRRQSYEDRQQVLTMTLLAVVVKFLICHTLPAVLDFCETVMDEQNFSKPLMENFVDTSNLLVVANSSLNIFIYAACSRSFRRRLKSVFATTSGNGGGGFDMDYERRRSRAESISVMSRSIGNHRSILIKERSRLCLTE